MKITHHLGGPYQRLTAPRYETQKIDIVMPVYNKLEYRHDYSIISGCFWNRDYWDEINEVDGNVSDGYSIKYKPKIVGDEPERSPRSGNEEDAYQPPQPTVPCLNIKVIIPFKHHNNFWRSLDLPLGSLDKL